MGKSIYNRGKNELHEKFVDVLFVHKTFGSIANQTSAFNESLSISELKINKIFN